jgi:undecaprenyl-diphosphatase
MACNPALVSWGNPSIAWIAENVRHPWLDPIMQLVSGLGETGAILFTISLGYWLWNKRAMRTLGYALYIAILFNVWIKGMVMECRPPSEFWLEYNLDLTKSFSFPSGHAQASIVLWGGLAYYFRKSWAGIFFAVTGLLVGLSRPYLGVHYPHDVLAAWVCGLSVLATAIYFEKNHINMLRNFPLSVDVIIMLSFLASIQLVIYDPTTLSLKVSASLFGFWLGSQLEAKTLQFTPNAQFPAMFIQSFIGLAGIGLLWKGIHIASAMTELPELLDKFIILLQYTLLGIWITYGAPAVFTKWRFARYERA